MHAFWIDKCLCHFPMVDAKLFRQLTFTLLYHRSYDVIVFSKTPEEHLLRLRAVFEKLKQVGLKLKPSKCELFRQELIYLGHVASKNGIQTDPKKVEAICKWPVPTNVTEVRSFLGFTNYYGRFIKKYAQVAKHLYKLISGENASRKQNPIKWDLECQNAFDNLKRIVHYYTNFGLCRFCKTFQAAHQCQCVRLWHCLVSGT